MDPMLRDLRDAASVEAPPERKQPNFKRLLYIILVLLVGVLISVAGFLVYPKLAAMRAPFSKWERVEALGTRRCYSIATYGSAVFVGAKGRLFKSFDEGDTWEADEYWSDLPRKNSIDDQPWEIIFNDTGINVYASSVSGLHVSTDAGATWSQLPFNVYVPSLESEIFTISDVEICRQNDQILYVELRNAHLAKSVDGGKTWTLLHEWISPEFLKVSQQDPNFLYLDISPTKFSQDGGLTIEEIPGSFPGLSLPKAVYLDPNDASRIIAVGLGGVAMSVDSGATWLPAGQQTEWWDPLAPDYPLPKGAQRKALSIDDLGFIYTSIAVHPLNRNVMAVSAQDEGVLLSVDAGMTWHKLNQGLPEKDDKDAVEFGPLAWSPDGSQLYLLTSGGLFILE